jgi:hypothetical protein
MEASDLRKSHSIVKGCKIKDLLWDGHAAEMRTMRKVYRILKSRHLNKKKTRRERQEDKH